MEADIFLQVTAALPDLSIFFLFEVKPLLYTTYIFPQAPSNGLVVELNNKQLGLWPILQKPVPSFSSKIKKTCLLVLFLTALRGSLFHLLFPR